MEQENLSPNTASFQEVTSSLHHAQGNDRLYTILFKRIEELTQDVYELKTQKILDETKMPPELLEQSGLLPPKPNKLRRGHGARPLLRSEIEEAIKQSPFCTDQAKWLGVHVNTYRRYAVRHGLWNPQPHHKGCKKPWNPEKGKYPLSKILAGEMNNNVRVTDWMVRGKLLFAKTFPAECAVCGYNKTHMITKEPILLLDHLDGDVHNYKKENLRFLCWNCTIECARGYIRRGIGKIDPGFLTSQ